MKRLFMKTAQLACAFTFLLSNQSKAQIDTSTTKGLLQYIFQNIDKSQVPTGFLEEYGCPILPMATFNGTLTDSNRIDMNLWRTLYFQLQTGYVGSATNPLPAITSVNTTIKQNSGSNVPVPIPLLIGQYNTVKSYAFTNNLLSYNSSTKQIYDVSGRGENPYQLRNLFAAAPNLQFTTTGSASFIVSSSLTWNNTGKTISQIQIDFDNGAGFQTLTIGTAKNVSYTTTGTKRWTIKITLNDNTVLQCYSEYYVTGITSSGNIAARYQTSQTVIPSWGFVNAVAGVHSGCTVYVNYSSLNRTNTLRKPLIIVEGYDVSRIAPSMSGNYSFDDFIKAINEPTNFFDFNGQLDDLAGYDLVFVDYNNGTDDIRRNAALIEEVINRVNTNKVVDGRFGNIRQQNVVMGLSMGGLVARYALAEMTKNNQTTETRLLITHDSPHRGANVPLGIQYLIHMAGGFQLFGYNVYDIYPNYDEALNLLKEPATQQLLIYRATGPNTFVTNTFLDGDYRSMITFSPTDPQPSYRFIATSQGNECAHQLFDPGKTFINLGAGVSAGVYGRVLFFRVPIVTYKLASEVEAYALPNPGSTAKIARLYTINNLKLFGLIDVFKQLYSNTAFAPGNHIAVDGAPGSYHPLLDVPALAALGRLPQLGASIYVTFPLGPFLGAYFGINAYNAGVAVEFTFVPVTSALDISPFNNTALSQKYVNGTNQSYPSTSETYIAQETTTSASTTNNAHLRFTARNSEWLFREMENMPNTLNCSSECFNPYYIAGASSFCSSSSYFVPGLPSGATVTWTTFPSGVVSVSCSTCNPVTLTKQTDGMFSLTATIGNACGNNPTIISKNLVAGPPPITILGPYDPVEHTIMGVACTSQQYYFVASDTETGQSYTWTLFPPPGSNDFPSLYSGSTVYLTFTELGYYTLRVSKTNSCGSSSTEMLINAQDCLSGFSIMASPNPAYDQVTVSIMDENAEVKTLSKDAEVKMELFRFNTGDKQKQWTFRNTQKQFSLGLHGVAKGIYILKVTKGKYQAATKVIVE